jgi:hypothetical protein
MSHLLGPSIERRDIGQTKRFDGGGEEVNFLSSSLKETDLPGGKSYS